MDLGERPSFLARRSAGWIDAADEGDPADLPPGMAENRWLGFAGATEERLLAAEQRLGRRLRSERLPTLRTSSRSWRSGYAATRSSADLSTSTSQGRASGSPQHGRRR
ncbi:hypothetical protein ACFQ9X_12805 [Catenulispora yoronensis]